MDWHLEVRQWIEEKRYDLVCQFYEELVENDPLAIEHYWYLGLAYLLAAREEAIWLFVIGQAEAADIEAWTIDLVTVLDNESRKQEELQNFDRSRLIREQIREILPHYLDNILGLILAEIKLNQFHLTKLTEWNVVHLLALQSTDPDLLEEVLEGVIAYPHKDSIDFVRVSLVHLVDRDPFIDRVLTIARKIAYQRKLPLYSSDLLEVFREAFPDNWMVAVNLFWFYISTPNFPKAYQLARELIEQSDRLDLKLFSHSLFLNGLMRGSNWAEIPAIGQKCKQLIRQFVEEKPTEIHPFVRDSLLTVMNPISYYEDNPLENRPLLAQIGAYFQENYREALGWQENHTIAIKSAANRRIKIGYIAGTFRRHPVGLLSRWLMQYHDRDQFQITQYLIDQPVDEITEKWFLNSEDTVRQFPLDSLAITRQIQEDGIDILVDLDSGTTVGIAAVMCLKPAPIQVNWLGFDGSGLPAIDYLLADPYVLPEEAQDYYCEKIWRLPNTFVAVDGFEVWVPSLRREDLGIEPDAVVYLSSQTALKRNPDHIRLQLQILKAVPHSYFLVQGVADEENLRSLFFSIAVQENIHPERIKTIPLYPLEIYRANLGIADVILDTYPFNGGTTTLEALWMGIPTVTKVGRQWSSRNGYTLLTNAGLTEGIAWNDAEYIDWGIRLGTDTELRNGVRWKLHQSRHTSPLWNTRQFTRELESAYRQMWERSQ
jgi:predicted O-linked N-acetylglucosamine transferase (SPINDLY family)